MNRALGQTFCLTEEVDIDLDDLHIAAHETDNANGEELESEPEKPEG